MADHKKTVPHKAKPAPLDKPSALSKPAKQKSPQPALSANKPVSPAKPSPDSTGTLPRAAIVRDALKKKDLIELVTATTGAKKTTVREIVDATLAVLGDALSKGTMLNLPPFGKAKVSRGADAASGKAMTVKLRRSAAMPNSLPKQKQSLADAED